MNTDYILTSVTIGLLIDLRVFLSVLGCAVIDGLWTSICTEHVRCWIIKSMLTHAIIDHFTWV